MKNTTLSLKELITLLHNHPDVITLDVWSKNELYDKVKDRVEDYYDIDNPDGLTIEDIIQTITDRIWIEEAEELTVTPNEYHDAWEDIVYEWLHNHHEELNLKEWEEQA